MMQLLIFESIQTHRRHLNVQRHVGLIKMHAVR